MRQGAKHSVLPFLWLTAAAMIYAVGFNWCFAPNHIGFGGVTGVAQIINALEPRIPVGGMTAAVNVPLFLLAWKLLGKRVLVGSLYAMAMCAVCVDLVDALYTFPTMDPVLACIFGGVMLGVSLGIVFQQGVTTGGTDLIARMLKRKLAWLSMGKLLLAIDLVVIVTAALVFHSLSSCLYGVVALFISTRVMDGVLYGLDTAKVAYIISDRPEEIKHAIVHDIRRGVTALSGKGGYSGTDKQVLLVAFKQRQIVEIKRAVKEIDPAAFLIVCEAHEVLGDGFGEYKQNGI